MVTSHAGNLHGCEMACPTVFGRASSPVLRLESRKVRITGSCYVVESSNLQVLQRHAFALEGDAAEFKVFVCIGVTTFGVTLTLYLVTSKGCLVSTCCSPTETNATLNQT